MTRPILPFAHPLFLCERYVRGTQGKVGFLGGFHSISPQTYPHVHHRLYVIAHLSGGLEVNTYIDVRYAATNELAATTTPREVEFPDRDLLVRLAVEFRNVPFRVPGIYFFQLYCEHTDIADIRVRLREPASSPNGGHE